jgi:hypothetical protein
MDIFDTNVLVQLVPNLLTSQNFLLDRFFPNIVTADSEYVSIDVDVGKRRMAPFCSPLVEGKLVESRKYQTNTFKPPYIKDRRAPDLRKPVRRQIGERIGGELTGEERMMANLQFEMADQIDMLNRRLEWMASSALRTATITVAGDGFPTTVIDFGRDASLTITLSGGDRWGQTGVSPAQNIETWAARMLKASGVVATDLVFALGAWQEFIKDEIIAKAIWYPNGGGTGNAVNIGAEIKKGAQYKGRWGSYELWLYNDWYVDDNNVEQPMLADNTVVMSGPELMGTRAFGQILDPEFAYAPMPYAPKSWVTKDPAQRFVLMQSAPLVIPSRVNGCLCATVK